MLISRRKFIVGFSAIATSGAVGPSSAAIARSAEVEKDDSLLLYDDFKAPSESFHGRIPSIGPAWIANGANASLLRVEDGQLGQKENNPGSVAYAVSPLTEVPGELVCSFIWGNGDQPPVMSIFPDSTPDTVDFSDLRLLHIYLSASSFGPELGEKEYFGDLNANHPFAWRGPEQRFQLVVGKEYTFAACVTGKWLFMKLMDAQGSIIAQSQSYDSRVPLVVGRFAFFEVFDNEMAYRNIYAKRKTDFPVPAMTPIIDTYFPINADVVKTSPFGGSVTWISAGKVRIDTDRRQGSGMAIDVGSLSIGDKVRVCVDVNAMQDGGIVVGLLPWGGDASPISNLVDFSHPGRQIVNLVCTSPTNAGFLCVGSRGGEPRSFEIKGAFVVKNGPERFV